MPIIVSADPENRKRLVWHDTNAGATVGRWANAPQVPDLCYTCFDPKTLAHYPAEGYTEEPDSRGNGLILRKGTCHRCHPECA